jgi:hypothetical protein
MDRYAAARKTLRAFGLEVESVAPFRQRFGNEFAAIVVMNGEANNGDFRAHAARQYDRALEVLTDPRCPLVVTGEFTGRDDIRIYVAFATEA